jgi:hypothetical protein
MARVHIEPLPIDALTARLEAIHYECFHVVDHDANHLDIECGFRWSPPFEKLLAVTADLHVTLRCLYDEDGCGFMGAWRARDGTVEQDNRIDYY